VRLRGLRRLASAVMRHASRTLPPDRASWGKAMDHEFHHIDDDLEALRWALGCAAASYVERGGVVGWARSRPARLVLALLIARQTVSMLFAPALWAACRLHDPGLARFLGGFTPGDDYRRFIPLLQATPWWVYGLWIVAAGFFLVSAWHLLSGERAAFHLFAFAWALGSLGNWVAGSLPAYKAAFSFPEPLFSRDCVVPAVTTVVPLLIAGALWAHWRRSLAADRPTGEAF
jgi:hypothetical protein